MSMNAMYVKDNNDKLSKDKIDFTFSTFQCITF